MRINKKNLGYCKKFLCSIALLCKCKSRAKICSFTTLFVLSSLMLAHAGTTRYVDPASPNPSGGYTSWGTAAHDISMGLGAMSGGDTLIIRNGTYTGTSNMIVNNIPSGSAEKYTIVKAENDFGVIIDAQVVNNRQPLHLSSSNNYIEIHGIEFRQPGDMGQEQASSPVFLNSCNHIKMFRCGAFECAQQAGDSGWGDMSNIFCFFRTSYCLAEECYAWGWGKYVFYVYQGDHNIFRRCVGRQDGWAWGIGDIFTNYSSTYTEYQNCIAIDFDESRHWHPQVIDGLWGGFNINGSCSNITYRGCIAINIKGLQGVTIRDANANPHSADYHFAFRLGSTGDTTTMVNCAAICSVGGVLAYDNVQINNCTFAGMLLDSGNPQLDYDGYGIWAINSSPVVKNTIFYDAKYRAISGTLGSLSDYNAYYANNSDGTVPGSHNLKATNILWADSNTNGGLKYPIRIESGSNLSGKGESGTDIGADITKRYGISGSLYGEIGYTTLTDEDLWSFPNEEIIRSRMRTYNRTDTYDNSDENKQVNGARGFCADGMTLTKYIWEYLGNAVPSIFYSGNQSPIANAGPDQNMTDTNNSGTEEVTLDGSNSSDPDGTIVSYIWKEAGAEIANGIKPTVTLSVGSHDISLTVTDDDGADVSDAVVITINPYGNQSPVADAGQDRSIPDAGNDGTEEVTLDGSNSSDPDGTIVSYIWKEAGAEIANGIKPTVTLSVGSHDISLTVTDDDGADVSDAVVITINPYGNQSPVADAGQDRSIPDAGNDGTEEVTLDGSNSSDPDGTIVSYIWKEAGAEIANGIKPTVSLSLGSHDISLTVTDNNGAENSDTVNIQITSFSVLEKKINFQPSGASIPTGYMADGGLIFEEARGYGWDRDLSSRSIDRNMNPDQRLDTQVWTDDSVRTWEVSLPDGEYLVTLGVGEPEYASGDHKVVLEGEQIINASTEADQFITVEDHSVTVSDGKLTMQIGGGDSGGDPWGLTRINYIVIKSVSGSALPPPDSLSAQSTYSIELSWSSVTGAVGYNVYRSITQGIGYVKINSDPVTGTSYLDENTTPGVTYYYVVTSLNPDGVEGSYSPEASCTEPLAPPANQAPQITGFTAVPSSLNNPGESTTFNVSATDPDGDSLTYTINFGDGTANGSGSPVVHTYETKGTYTAEVSVDDGNGHIVGESLQVPVNDIRPAEPTNVSAN